MTRKQRNFFDRFWQVDCIDKQGTKHSWRFPHDDEGKREACDFCGWLKRQHKNEYANYVVWDF